MHIRDTPSEKTCLWQLPIVSSVFNQLCEIGRCIFCPMWRCPNDDEQLWRCEVVSEFSNHFLFFLLESFFRRASSSKSYGLSKRTAKQPASSSGPTHLQLDDVTEFSNRWRRMIGNNSCMKLGLVIKMIISNIRGRHGPLYFAFTLYLFEFLC